MTSGQVNTVALPDGHFYFSTLGSTVVTTTGTPGDSRWHLLDARDDGSVSDRTVEGVPSGVHTQSAAGLGDAHGQVVRYRKGDDEVTGHGRADLVSRDTVGTVWRNDGNGKGSFGGRTKTATGRQGYKGLF
ncbi:hypothetical protein [Streptomyces sp. LN245]|uniref:hypothetical protein n=1 Tax=Streptomyces sp. LN245 TaxID=3112975 RepID=UPI0037185025